MAELRLNLKAMYQNFKATNNFSKKTKVKSSGIDVFNSEDYSDNLRIYYNELAKIPTLTKEEETELIQNNIKNGILNEYARKRLLEGNLKFVFTVAARYRGSGVSLEEMIEQGNYGLVKAVNKFDYKKGYRFYCYAVWWIKAYISQYIKDEKKSSSKQDLLNENSSNDDDIEDDSQVNDLWSDVETDTDIPFDDSYFGDDSTDNEPEDNDEVYTNDSESYLEHKEIQCAKNEFFKNISSTLTKDEMKVIQLNFGLGKDKSDKMSVKKIAEIMGINTSKVKTIKDRAMKKLKKMANNSSILSEFYM